MFRISRSGGRRPFASKPAEGSLTEGDQLSAPLVSGPEQSDLPGENDTREPAIETQVTETEIPGNPAPAMQDSPTKPAVPSRERPLPVSRPRTGGIALALGGGAARGWAHIGVLKALDEAGIEISMIAGTSIGALVGGCYLAGVLDELEDFARSLTKSNMLRYMDFTLRGSGLISGAKLASRMEAHMSDMAVEDLPIPFVSVATDIHSGHEIWLHDGPLIPALRASYALPGVFTPIFHNGRYLVDGALVNPVPVSACRAYEPDVVIAINLNAEMFGRGTVIRGSHYDNAEVPTLIGEAASSWFPFLRSEDHTAYHKNRLGVTTVMMEAFNIIQDRIARARLAGDPPDYTVRPKLKRIGLSEFYKAAESIDLGYTEMTIRLRELENQGALEGLRRHSSEQKAPDHKAAG